VDDCLEKCLVSKFVRKFNCSHARLRGLKKNEEDLLKPPCTYEHMLHVLIDPDDEEMDPGLKFIELIN